MNGVALTAFNSSNSIETIKGDGAGDAIVAAQNVNTGNAYGALDLSSTTLVNIAQIRGTSANDDITGSKGADTIFAGDGNDTIRESGGADVIDGGTGTNVFVTRNALASYSGGYTNPDGTKSYNSGTSWKLVDGTGTTITLTNIQSVQFTDQALTSSTTNHQSLGGSASNTEMRFIASGTASPSAASAVDPHTSTVSSLQGAAASADVLRDYAHALPQGASFIIAATDGLLDRSSLGHTAVDLHGLAMVSGIHHQLLAHTS